MQDALKIRVSAVQFRPPAPRDLLPHGNKNMRGTPPVVESMSWYADDGHPVHGKKWHSSEFRRENLVILAISAAFPASDATTASAVLENASVTVQQGY